MPTWLPTTDAELAVWMLNWKTKVTNQFLLNMLFSDSEASRLETKINQDYNFVHDIADYYEQLSNDFDEVTQWKESIINGDDDGSVPTAPEFSGSLPGTNETGIVERITKLAARIKLSPNYTVAIGEDLGIEENI